MKTLYILVCAVALVSTPILSLAGVDVKNGWSGSTTISSIYSDNSKTHFQLQGVVNGCGHPDFWSLAMSDTTWYKSKLALLLSAYMSGKPVNLRCEGSQLTDFIL
jgi:hypothetical protein